jgi:NTP pyrophosphatase (non-canonical NTP hydrolase)
MEIKELCEKSYETAVKKGFWKEGRTIPEMLMLIVTELGEACEADRKGDTENFKEEVADVFIRLGDMVKGLNIDIEEEILKKMKINEGRSMKHGKKY